MMQISTIVFSLLLELIFVLLVVLGVWTFLTLKRSKQDRTAVAKLVEQVRHQSDLRLKETGSFLEEKYRFEGSELKKAVESIDKAEKKFIQKVINMYLKRDPHEMEAMDASMAELIEAYKELTPANVGGGGEVAETDDEALPDDLSEEVEQLRSSNQKLTEELAITKKTMGNMIAEFGNMFGGGQENALESEEVLEKVNVVPDEEEEELIIAEATEPEIPAVSAEEPAVAELDAQPDAAMPENNESEAVVSEPQEALETPLDQPAEVETPEEKTPDDKGKAEQEEKKSAKKDESLIDFDEGIDELMDGIDLSEDV